MKKHNQNNLTVVKHNNLNQASYKMTLDERRLILSSIALVNPKEPMPDEVTIHASDYAHQWGLDERNAYEQLKEARANLFERKITLCNGNKGRDIRWVYDTEYADGEGYIKLSFSPTVAPYLSDLGGFFTSYHLMEIRNFKSGHAIRLYELLMQFKKNGWFDEDLEVLKSMFGVGESYPLWYDFRRKVIDVSIKEINESTNYTVKYSTKKRGRKISRVVFTFARNEQSDMFKPPN